MAGVFFSEICIMLRPGTVFLGKRNFHKIAVFSMSGCQGRRCLVHRQA